MSSTALATQDDNYFAAYARAAAPRAIVGDLLKFQKGEYVRGAEEEEVEEGTRFVAIMDRLEIGWVKWEGGKPVQHEVGPIAEGYRPPSRGELGDHDETRWEKDQVTGKPRDPWAKTNLVLLKEVEGDRLLTFTTSSKGGLSAVGQLCEAYGRAMRQKPSEFPIIEVGTSSYRHDTYGKVKVPVLKVVGWTNKATALAALEGAAAAAADPVEADEADEVPF